jgi:hypothetical protein
MLGLTVAGALFLGAVAAVIGPLPDPVARALLRFARRGRPAEAGHPEEPECEPEPAWAPLAPPEFPVTRPAFTIPQEVRLRALSDWLWSASDGARGMGEDLADRMQKQLPDVPEATLAAVLLEVLAVVEDAEGAEVTAHDALLVIKDGLRGAAPIIAAPTLGLEPEAGRRAG